MDNSNIDVWLALVAAVFGGAGLKLVESFMTRKQRRDDLLSKIIAEKDKEIERLSGQISKAEKAEIEWREKYWDLREGGNAGPKQENPKP